MELVDLPIEILCEIFSDLPWLSLKAFIKQNRRLEQVLNTEYFWIRRYKSGTFGSGDLPPNISYKHDCIKLELGYRYISIIDTYRANHRKLFIKLGKTQYEAIYYLQSVLNIGHNMVLVGTDKDNEHRLYVGEKCQQRRNRPQELQAYWHGFPLTEITTIYVLYGSDLLDRFKDLMQIFNNSSRMKANRLQYAHGVVKNYVNRFISQNVIASVVQNAPWLQDNLHPRVDISS